MSRPEPLELRAATEAFDSGTAMARLAGTDEAVNAAVECCDRHPAEAVALEYVGQTGARQLLTFGELRDMSHSVAHVLRAAGIGPGDRVAGLLPRQPALLAVMLGVWRLGAVWQPLFTAFGPAAIEHRLRTAGTRVVVTDVEHRGKVEPFEGCPAVMVVGRDVLHGTSSRPPDPVVPVMRRAEDPFLLMFTSGTTGPAKAVAVPLRAIAAFIGYLEQAVDLRPEDRLWNLADPGWAYGLYYAVVGPLALGHATTFFDGPFSVRDTVSVIERLGITNLCGSPTAFRMLIAAGAEALRPLRGLRVVSSAGEPLNPEVNRWFAEHLGVPILDQYGQTELGMVVCNHHGLRHAKRPGSAGFASPGHLVAVVDAEGRPVPRGQPGVLNRVQFGNRSFISMITSVVLERHRLIANARDHGFQTGRGLAVNIGASPLFWFRGYEGRAAPFVNGYYLSGDMVEENDDGSISFVGRSDDIITSSGYRIGPFDVESALIEHPAVVEAAVVGKPDPERTEIVKAFVVLQPGADAGEALAVELQAHVRARLSAHAYPREVAFVDALPKTPSGKLQRFVLRAQERGPNWTRVSA